MAIDQEAVVVSRERRRSAVFALSLLLPATLSACQPVTKNSKAMTDFEKANALVVDVARRRNLPEAALGPTNQVAYGTLLFRYRPDHQLLVCAILVIQDGLWDKINAQVKAAHLRVNAALSDPAVGGRFDTGGGRWMFDAATGKNYLFRDYPLDSSPAVIDSDLDRMVQVVPAWATRWMSAVARIAHGHEQPPTHPVTLADDPYAGRL